MAWFRGLQCEFPINGTENYFGGTRNPGARTGNFIGRLHKADNPTVPAFVRYWSNSGHAERGAKVKGWKLEKVVPLGSRGPELTGKPLTCVNASRPRTVQTKILVMNGDVSC